VLIVVVAALAFGAGYLFARFGPTDRGPDRSATDPPIMLQGAPRDDVYSSEPFRLSGGHYTVDTTAKGAGCRLNSASLITTDGKGGPPDPVARGIDGTPEGRTTSTRLYAVPAGTYYALVGSRCDWTVTIHPLTAS
jgi:hypothetical protein